ncbi:MAG: hypothetical protein ACLGI5_12320 [Thermoleophilia bacterium]
MAAAAEGYAELLADGIVASVEADPPPGLPARIVIRWFEGPGYLTVHALGADEEPAVAAEDAWHPLEWPNREREIGRVDAIVAQPDLAAAAASLGDELDGGSWPWDEQPEPLIAAAARIPGLLRDAGVAVAGHFAVGVCHFEGWGCEESVPRINPDHVVDALRQRGIEPGARRRRRLFSRSRALRRAP